MIWKDQLARGAELKSWELDLGWWVSTLVLILYSRLQTCEICAETLWIP